MAQAQVVDVDVDVDVNVETLRCRDDAAHFGWRQFPFKTTFDDAEYVGNWACQIDDFSDAGT